MTIQIAAARYTTGAKIYDALQLISARMAKKLPEVKKLSSNFADVFFVGKAKTLGKDDSANIDVVGEGVPLVKTKQKMIAAR